MRSGLSISSYSHAELKETHCTLGNGTNLRETYSVDANFIKRSWQSLLNLSQTVIHKLRKTNLHFHGTSTAHTIRLVSLIRMLTSFCDRILHLVHHQRKQPLSAFNSSSSYSTMIRSQIRSRHNLLPAIFLNLTINIKKPSLFSDRLQDPNIFDLVFCYSYGLS